MDMLLSPALAHVAYDIVVSCPERAGEPHRLESDPLPNVRADGLCLYYAVLACQDLSQWLVTNPDGNPSSFDIDAEQRSAAEAFRRQVIDFVSKANPLEAQRLELEGSAGYPDDTTVRYISAMLGHSILIQTGPVQFLAHDVAVDQGPLGMHLERTEAVDGDGNSTPHWRPIQSWLPRESARDCMPPGAKKARTEVVVSPTAPFDWNSTNRPGPPLSATTRSSLDDFLETMFGLGGGFSGMNIAIEESTDTDEILAASDKLFALVSSRLPDSPRDFQCVVVVVLILFACRIIDVGRRERVFILYAMFGRFVLAGT